MTHKHIDTVQKYEEHLESAELSPVTIESRVNIIRNLEKYLIEKYGLSLLSNEVSGIKGYMLDEYYKTLTCSPASRNLYVKYYKYFFKFLKDMGITDTDPSEVLRYAKIVVDESEDEDDDEYGMDKAYSTDDAVDLISVKIGKAVDARDRAIVAMLLAGGLRASELCRLNIGSFKKMRSGRILVQRKGGAKKWVFIADYAIEYIEEYLKQRPDAKDDEPLFTTTTGKRMNRNDVWKRMKRRQEKLGLKTGVHIMRHTYLTEIDRNTSTTVAQKLGAHSDKRITQRYIHRSNGELRDANNSLSWGRILQNAVDTTEKVVEESEETKVNKERRKRIGAVAEKLRELQDVLEDVHMDEEDAMGNMPENLQGSEKYEEMEESLGILSDVISNLEDAADELSEI